MNKYFGSIKLREKKLTQFAFSFLPIIILIFFVIPVAIVINPDLIPRYLGDSPTITRFGYLDLDKNMVKDFIEKHPDQEAYINSGFFVFEPEVFDYFEGEDKSLAVLSEVAKEKKLFTHFHYGYWQCMDTVRDKEILEQDFNNGNPLWLSQ